MPIRRTTAAIALIVTALSQPAWAQSGVDDAARAYVAATGFEVLPIEHIEGYLNDLIDTDPAAMLPADADIVKTVADLIDPSFSQDLIQ